MGLRTRVDKTMLKGLREEVRQIEIVIENKYPLDKDKTKDRLDQFKKIAETPSVKEVDKMDRKCKMLSASHGDFSPKITELKNVRGNYRYRVSNLKDNLRENRFYNEFPINVHSFAATAGGILMGMSAFVFGCITNNPGIAFGGGVIGALGGFIGGFYAVKAVEKIWFAVKVRAERTKKKIWAQVHEHLMPMFFKQKYREMAQEEIKHAEHLLEHCQLIEKIENVETPAPGQ